MGSSWILCGCAIAALSSSVAPATSFAKPTEVECCLTATEFRPSWPECHTACNTDPCPTGPQLGAIIGGICDAKAGGCSKAGGTINIHSYKCIGADCGIDPSGAIKRQCEVRLDDTVTTTKVTVCAPSGASYCN